MKKFFMLCLLVVTIFFFTSCASEWKLVEESVLKSAEYHKGSFSVSPYWELTFESGAVMRIGASRNQMLFVGKAYEVYYKESTGFKDERYHVRLKK